jgi:hypothetical protein
MLRGGFADESPNILGGFLEASWNDPRIDADQGDITTARTSSSRPGAIFGLTERARIDVARTALPPVLPRLSATPPG